MSLTSEQSALLARLLRTGPTITFGGAANIPPVADPDVAVVGQGLSVLIDVAANDTDLDGTLDLTSVAIITDGTYGTAVDQGDGTVLYTHDDTENFADSFTYTIDDDEGATSNITTVTVTITPTPVVVPVGLGYYEYSRYLAPVGYWRFNDQVGPTAGYEGLYAGSYQGAPTLKVDSLLISDPDNAVTFPSIAYMSSGDQDEYDITGAVTLSAWVKRDGLHVGGNNRGILGKWLGSGNNRSYDMYVQQSTGNLSCAVSTSGSYEASGDFVGTKNVLDNVAHHVVAVFEPSTHVRLYVDGVQVDEWTSSIPASIYASTQDIWVGMTFANSSLNTFDGTIDEPKIFPHALSPTDVRLLYDLGVSARSWSDLHLSKDPVLYLKFDESSGTTVTDSSDEAKHGTVSGSYTQFVATDVEGSSGALSLDGTDGKVSVPALTSPSSNIGHSVSLWLKADSNTTTYAVAGFNAQAPFWMIRLSETTNRRIRIQVYNTGGGANINWDNSEDHTVWNHIAFTSVTGGTLRLYFNGQEVGSASMPAGSYATVGGGANNNIGTYRDSSGDYLSGDVDELIVVNRVLLASEVCAIYKAGVNGIFAPIRSYEDESLAENNGNYWRFGESSGTVAIDARGVNDGTYINVPTLGVGGLLTNDSDTAVHFDGSSQYVSVSGLNPTSFPLTFSIWVNLDSFGASVPSFFATNAVSVTYTGVAVAHNSAGNVSVRYGNGGGNGPSNRYTHSTANGILSAGTTHHIVAVCTNFSTVNIYVDGVDIGLSTSGSAGAISWSGGTFEIGRDVGGGGGAAYVDGKIDEPRLYYDALTHEEILELYRAGNGTARVMPGTYKSLAMAQIPAGYWRLGEESGSTALDAACGSHHGTYQGSPTLEETSLINDSDTCVTFGASDYLLIDDHADFDITGALTLSAWVKRNGVYGSGNGRGILSKDLGSSNQRSYSMYVDRTTGYLSFANSTSGAWQAANRWVSTTNVLDNIAHHVVAVFEPSSSVRLYVDGTMIDEWTSSIPASMYASSADVWVGSTWDDHIDNAFDGTIDEPKILARALSEEEIATEYAAGKYGLDSYAFAQYRLNPFAYWRLGEASGTTAYDETGNRFDGTFISGMEGSTGVITGDSDTCFTWLLATHEVDIGTQMNATTNGLSALSISGWIYFSSLPSSANTGRVLMRNDSAYRLYYYYDSVGENGFYFLLNGITSTLAGSPKIPTGSLTTGVWYHIVGTYDGSEAKIYVNGFLEDTKTGLSGTIASSTDATRLGVDSAGSNYWHVGNMDEVAMYPRALTAAEVRMLYDRGRRIF